MASLEYLAAGTRNEALSRGWPFKLAQLKASGFQFPPCKHGPEILRSNSKFNGGVGIQIFARLEAGERVFRFSDTKRAKTREDRVRGEWWFDWECYLTLRKLSGGRDSAFRDTARANFAVLEEWGDMGNLVTGKLKSDFWCIKGMSAPATGATRISGRFTLDVLQLFVPGGFALADLDRFSDAVLTRLVY